MALTTGDDASRWRRGRNVRPDRAGTYRLASGASFRLILRWDGNGPETGYAGGGIEEGCRADTQRGRGGTGQFGGRAEPEEEGKEGEM